MSKSERELITELKAILSSHRYSPVVIGNYCAYAQEFLDYLMQRGILVADVTEAEVARYLCHAVALFRSAVVEIPASAGTKFRSRVFTHCCDLCRIGGHLLQK